MEHYLTFSEKSVGSSVVRPRLVPVLLFSFSQISEPVVSSVLLKLFSPTTPWGFSKLGWRVREYRCTSHSFSFTAHTDKYGNDLEVIVTKT